MSIGQTDMRVLLMRSGGLCALCKRELTLQGSPTAKTLPIAEVAHIVAEQGSGPRGSSALSDRQLASAHNLMVLCPTCHTIIDKDVDTYPVEKLYTTKAEHEDWVREKLGPRSDRDEAEARVWDGVIPDVQERFYKDWTNLFWGPLQPTPLWRKSLFESIDAFREKVSRTIWPGTLPELRASIERL